MKLHWPWLTWQVAVPLGGPVVLSWLIILLWRTGNPDFVPQWSSALSFTPWEFTFYALALLGATLNELWPQIQRHVTLGWLLIGTASVTEMYTALLVIWRHSQNFVPPAQVYICSMILLGMAISVSYLAHSNSRGNSNARRHRST